MILLQLGGAFLLGLMGTPHCLAMCGPIALANASGPPGTEACAKRALARSAWVQAGRGMGYGTLGVVAGATLPVAQTLTTATSLQLAAKVLCGLSLVAVGLASSGLLAPLLRRLPRVFGTLSRLRTRFERIPALERSPALAQLVKGLLWALLPCGMIYAGLGLALSAGSPLRGGLVMAAFFVGTLPSMTFVLGALRTLEARFSLPRIRLATGLLVGLAGLVQLEAVASTLAAPPADDAPARPTCACHAEDTAP